MASADRLRYHYIDWMRICVFLLLMLYHSARAFFPEDPWHINDPEGSWFLRISMDLVARWRLPLLFFISGLASAFVLSSRNIWQFLGNRLLRLVIPLIFAMLVVVPPQIWLERVFKRQTDLDFFTWYTGEAFTMGTYPEGNISWHHMWYIAYLFVMTILLLPVLISYSNEKLIWLNRATERISRGPQLMLLFLFPLLIQNTLGRIWPGRNNALLGDWGWLALTGSWFLIGFLIKPFLEQFAQSASKWVRTTATLWLVMTGIIVWAPGSDDFKFHFGESVLRYDDALTVPIAWMAILTLTGIFSLHFNTDSKAKRYLNRAVYPLYIVHQTIAVTAVFFLIPLDISVWTKFALTLLATFGLSFGLHHFVLRHLGPFRIVFGIPFKRRF